MTDEQIFSLVQDAVIWAKSEVVTLTRAQVAMDTVLAEPPVYLDSLEFIAMVTRLEEQLGLIAQDEHFPPHFMRTVADVVAGVTTWIAEAAGQADVTPG